MTEREKLADRPATIVISDWLANCRAGQWTPFEAAIALKAALKKEGYSVALDSYIEELETCSPPPGGGVREALEFIRKRSIVPKNGADVLAWAAMLHQRLEDIRITVETTLAALPDQCGSKEGE